MNIEPQEGNIVFLTHQNDILPGCCLIESVISLLISEPFSPFVKEPTILSQYV